MIKVECPYASGFSSSFLGGTMSYLLDIMLSAIDINAANIVNIGAIIVIRIASDAPIASITIAIISVIIDDIANHPGCNKSIL